MALFLSKPQQVEAIQWTGDNGQELIDAHNGKVTVERWRPDEDEWHCTLLAGVGGAQDWVPVPVGHWIVHPPGDLADIWPVQDEVFRSRYDALIVTE